MKTLLTLIAILFTTIALSQNQNKPLELSSDTIGLLHQVYGSLDKDLKSGKVELLIYRDDDLVGFILVIVNGIVIFKTFR